MSFRRERWSDVFLSYSTEDENLATDIHDFLKKFSINPIRSTYYRKPDEYLSNKIAQLIMDSNYFVAILTQNSIHSQWVNQEMGFTHALQRMYELSQTPTYFKFYHHIPIYRLVDTNIENEIKGFFNAKEHTPMNIYDLSEAKYCLLADLRSFINRNENVVKEVEVVCSVCKFPYKEPLPNQTEINEAISKSFLFPTFCKNPNCRTQNNLNPKTFEVS